MSKDSEGNIPRGLLTRKGAPAGIAGPSRYNYNLFYNNKKIKKFVMFAIEISFNKRAVMSC